MIKPKELVRSGLESELEEIWQKKMVIVNAPSGYGKTTLVRSFLQKYPLVPAIWLSFGQEELDEELVWRKLCIKCEEFSHMFGEKLRKLGRPSSPTQIDFLVGLIARHVVSPVFVVVDDFQECNSANINRLLTRLVYEEINKLHIILITRTHPELPYEEMFLRGYCTIIDQNMMALSRDETRHIFEMNGIVLEENELDQIHEYTEGWISAVYLALFEYRRSGMAGRYNSISHLLKTSIFEKLSPELQDIYMKISLFDSMTLEEVVYVTEADIHPMALMETMEQYGFMQYDLLSRRYEMHALLRTVAAGELERHQIPKARLCNRAGEWRVKNGEYIQGIINFRNAGNLDAIFRLLSGEMRSIIFEEAHEIIKDIFLDTPVEIISRYPTAWLSYIYSIIINDDHDWGARLFEKAKTTYSLMYDFSCEKQELKGELLFIQSLLQFNDLEKIIPSIHEAYELLGRQPSRIFRQSLLTYGVPFMTILYYNRSGGLKRTIELEKEYARYHMRLVGGGDAGWDDLFDAEYALLTGDMETACRLSIQVGEKAVLRKQTCIIISSYYIRMRCLIYFGNVQEFEHTGREFARMMKDVARPYLIVDWQLAYSYPFACLGRQDKITDWVRDFKLEGCSRVIRNTRTGCIIYGVLLCNSGQWALLDTIAEQSIVPYESTRHVYAVIRGYLFKAIAVYHLEGIEKARSYFEKAIEVAEPDEVRIPFVESSRELMPIMEEMRSDSKFFLSLKPLLRQYQKSLKLFSQGADKKSLTNREKELMDLVKEGYRNSQISEKLNIAQVTVEKNLTSIYRKLNVTNRAAAIARIKEI